MGASDHATFLVNIEGGTIDCEDFDTQEEAEEVYEQNPSDPYHLNSDDDNVACELL